MVKKLRTNPFGLMAAQFIFWMCFFIVARFIFLVYQWPLLENISIGTMLLSFYHGLLLDISMISYILILPFLLIIIFQWFKNQSWLYKILGVYHLIVLILSSIIVSTELELFVEWETKLNYKAISYFKNPAEVWGVTSLKVFLINILLISAQLLVFHYLYRNLVGKTGSIKSSLITKASFILVIPGFLLLGLRGGLQQVPINQSSAYYSKNNTLNNAATNSVWNFTYSIANHQGSFDENPFTFYDQSKVIDIFKALMPSAIDSTIDILKSNRPNVVFVILEGWSSDLIEPLGGYAGLTPEFNALASEGLLFSNIYASGLRSNEGIAAILSSLPSMPIGAVTNDPTKYKNIPVINGHFQDQGYTTLFGFGGELEYGNLKGYLIQAGFDKVIEGKDFDADIPRAKLGVHDEYAFTRYLDELNKLKEPFFSAWFTVSSHAPYDIPTAYTLDINGLETGYINAVNYCDKYLGKFFKDAREKDWYDNTLFVLVSDHGHSSPKKTPFYDADYRKIPLLFYGKVLKEVYKGKIIDIIGSQTDITSTLFHQLQFECSKFRWSKNLLNPATKEYAYFAFDDGFGWIDENCGVSYHLNLDRVLFQNCESDSLRKIVLSKGRAYLQESFQEYVDF